MKQDFEVSIDTDQPDVESVSVQKNGVFDKINRHTRTLAMWTLGLIGGGGIGCAHTPTEEEDRPPSMSSADLANMYMQNIENLYAPFSKNNTPLPYEDLIKLNAAIEAYLKEDPHSDNAVRAFKIHFNINNRSQRFAEKQRKVVAHLQTVPKRETQEEKEIKCKKAADELFKYIQLAQDEENRGNYEKAFGYYRAAEMSRRRVDSAFRTAGLPLPTEVIGKIDKTIAKGIATNGHAGVVKPTATVVGRRMSSSEAFEEGAKMVGEMIVDALPHIATATAAVSADVREDLDKKGLTATAEIRIAEYTFLSRYPIEDVEITIRRLGGSNFSQTSKTSKENLLETGGRVHFYLAPGWYEISSPLFKYSRTVELKKGLQSLEFQLR